VDTRDQGVGVKLKVTSTPQHELPEQMPRFEEIVDEPANSYQQAEISDITDDLSPVVDDKLVRGGAAGGQV
jgi:hypothetical protein